MVLLGVGVAASLAGVWALAGLSERSSLRTTPRVLLAVAVGVSGLALVYQRAPVALRIELSLPLLFGVVSVLGLATGAAKLDGALAAKNGPRASRRAAGLVAGSFLGMASVAAASFELLLRSLVHARFGWAFMLPTVASALVVFAQRGRLAGAGAKLLGNRGLALGVAGLLALAGGRLLVSPRSVSAEPRAAAVAVKPSAVAPVAAQPLAAEAPSPETTVPAPTLAASTAPSAGSGESPAPPGDAGAAIQVETVVARGMLEADARGGVARRLDRLEACLDDPNNRQQGVLSLKIGIDRAGSVTYSKATGGDLVGTPLAACLLPVFYKMGFAAPPADGTYFEITLRVP